MFVLTTLFALFCVLASVAISTFGGVLLAAFIMPRAASPTRVAAAVIGGPSILSAPFWVVVIAELGAGDWEAWIALGIVNLLICIFIAWPAAHFATRRLDRLIQFDVGTFA